MLNENNASNIANFEMIQASAVGVQLSKAGVHDSAEIERVMASFGSRQHVGLIVLASPTTNVNRGLIVTLAARYKLPAVYPFRYFVSDGGLVSYGSDLWELSRQAAFYVDRILRGNKPGDLPIQHS